MAARARAGQPVLRHGCGQGPAACPRSGRLGRRAWPRRGNRTQGAICLTSDSTTPFVPGFSGGPVSVLRPPRPAHSAEARRTRRSRADALATACTALSGISQPGGLRRTIRRRAADARRLRRAEGGDRLPPWHAGTGQRPFGTAGCNRTRNGHFRNTSWFPGPAADLPSGRNPAGERWTALVRDGQTALSLAGIARERPVPFMPGTRRPECGGKRQCILGRVCRTAQRLRARPGRPSAPVRTFRHASSLRGSPASPG